MNTISAWLTGTGVLLLVLSGLATWREMKFVRECYQVLGRVESEHHYLSDGPRRFYRVHFELRNGQRAHMRGRASAKRGPAVGELVPVLIRERDGEVKAILPGPDQWHDILLFSSIGLVLLILGGFEWVEV